MALQKKSGVVFGAMPKVDLLPEAQRAERRHRQLVPKLIAAVIVSAVVAAGIWAAGILPVMAANQRLATAEAESTALLTQIAQFTDEQEKLGAVSKITGERISIAAGEVLFIEVLDQIDGVLPKSSTIVGYTGRLEVEGAPSVDEALGVDLNPLCTGGVATVTVTIEGENLAASPAFIGKLGELEGVQCLASTKIEAQTSEDPQKLTVQLALNEDALANRFVEVAE